MKKILQTVFLMLLTIAGQLTAEELSGDAGTRYPLGNNSGYLFRMINDHDGIELIHSGNGKIILKIVPWVLMQEESGFPPRVTYGTVPARILSSKAAAATGTYLEVNLTAEYRGSSQSGRRNYKVEYSILISKEQPVALLRCTRLIGTDSVVPRIEGFIWRISVRGESPIEYVSGKEKEFVHCRMETLNSFWLKVDGNGVFRKGEKLLEMLLLPPEVFYLEENQSWEGFGAALGIILPEADNENVEIYQDTLNELVRFSRKSSGLDTH